MPPTLISLESDDRADFAHVGNVVIARARDQETARTFTLIEKHVRYVAETTRGKVGILLLVDHTKGPPPGFVDDAKGVLVRCGPILAGASSALLAQGFVAAVYRSMGAMLLRLVGKRDVVGIHGSVEDASAWILERLPPSPHTPDVSTLVAAAHDLLKKPA